MKTIDDNKPGSGIDSLLARFFRAQMPHPWPECEASAQARPTPLSRRSRALGRFALAASVFLFFLGYFTLSGYFPRDYHNVPTDGSPLVGKVPSPKSTLKPSLNNSTRPQ